MVKRIFSSLLAVLLLFGILPAPSFAASSFSNFTKVRSYQSGQFSDVAEEWYAPSVKAAYEYGLINGKTATSYEPQSNLTIAEAIKLAACIHSIYYTGSSNFQAGSPWYRPYVDYALAKNIIKEEYSNYEENATRAEFALIFSGALPEEACGAINEIPADSIPDVPSSYSYAPAVYKLYRAGILTGSDSKGTFYPNTYITRDACAAISIRMISPSYRQTLKLQSKELTAKDISEKFSNAVFYIELYDSAGNTLGSGSGFFINSSGLAVTNYHVIDGAASAKVTTKNGKSYSVSGVFSSSKTNDLALIQVDGCSGVEFLLLGDSDTVETGETIFAIGYPLGLGQTVTQGTITNSSHVVDGIRYMLFSASISSGSSGGALMNSGGKVIGVTTGTYVAGQNLNVAIPINLLKDMKTSNLSSLSSVSSQNSKPTLTASNSEISVAQGSQATVTFKASSDNFAYYTYTLSNEKVVSCSLGKWSGNTINVTVKGLSAGTSVLTLKLADENKNIISTAKVTITVTASSSSTVYYSGYYPVPDWGAFTRTPLYYRYYHDGTILYYYRLSDCPSDSSVGVAKYLKLLESCGFIYLSSEKSSDGYNQLYYSNNTWFVGIGLTKFNGTLCMCIGIVQIKK